MLMISGLAGTDIQKIRDLFYGRVEQMTVNLVGLLVPVGLESATQSTQLTEYMYDKLP